MPLRNRRGFFYNPSAIGTRQNYYEQFLRHKETELLDSVGGILQIELVLYVLRKLYLRVLDLEEEGKDVSNQLQAQEKRLRQSLSVEQTHKLYNTCYIYD